MYSDKCNIPLLKCSDGNVAISDMDKANMFSDNFCNFFTQDDGNVPIFEARHASVPCRFVDFSLSPVFRALGKLP